MEHRHDHERSVERDKPRASVINVAVECRLIERWE